MSLFPKIINRKAGLLLWGMDKSFSINDTCLPFEKSVRQVPDLQSEKINFHQPYFGAY